MISSTNAVSCSIACSCRRSERSPASDRAWCTWRSRTRRGSCTWKWRGSRGAYQRGNREILMTMRSRLFLVGAVVALRAPLAAQQKPSVRPLGPVPRVWTEPMAYIITAVPLSDGHVYVNDVVSRRVLLFDSTLATARIVADSTAVTSKAYGARPGTLFAFRADTVILTDPASASMPVLSPTGTIARVMAAPTVAGPIGLSLGNPFYPPGFDARGRLVTQLPMAVRFADPVPGKASTQTLLVDSSFIVRMDLDARTLDTVAPFKITKVN